MVVVLFFFYDIFLEVILIIVKFLFKYKSRKYKFYLLMGRVLILNFNKNLGDSRICRDYY